MTLLKNEERFEKQAALIPAKIKALVIKDDASLVMANNETRNIKAIRKEIADFFDPNIGRLHTAHKEAVAQKKKFDGPLAAAEKENKAKIAHYFQQVEDERRLAEDAAQKATQEAVEKAQAAAAAGDIKKAGEILDTPIVTPVIATPKLEGTYIVKLPKWRLINVNSIPKDYFMLDYTKITSVVKASKGKIEIPGIEIYFEDSVRMKQ